MVKIKPYSLPLLLIILFLTLAKVVSAQSDTLRDFSVDANVDLMSRYIWRGQEYGQAPSVQPGISVAWKEFTLGAWGAYKLTGAGDQETDIYLSKNIGPVTIAVWDYWCFSDTSSNNYFDYERNTTSHSIEAQLMISGGEKLPFNLLAGYFLYGADTTNSLYMELQYTHSIATFDFLFFAGFQPKGEFYGTNATFVNLGCTAIKNIKITEHFSVPLSVSAIANPSAKSVYLLAGITF